MAVEIIGRARWGARHDRGFSSAPLPAGEVWLHHSVTIAPNIQWIDANKDGVEDDEAAAMRTLENIGESRFGGGISYTFAVMPSGRIYEGHGVDRQGAHTGGRNSIARAIVLVGNYDTNQPTEAQTRAVAGLLQRGKAEGWWRWARLNGGHQQAPGASTACPGKHAMAAIPHINKLAAGTIPAQEDFMAALNDAQQKRLFDLVTRTHDRVFGALQQRWMRLVNGKWLLCGPKDPGARACGVLDTADGGHIVGRIAQLTERVVKLEAQIALARGEQVTEEEVRAAVAAEVDELQKEWADVSAREEVPVV